MFDEEVATKACEYIAHHIVRPTILGYSQGDKIAIETKPDLSPVTAADREIELRIRQFLASEFPNHGLLGEEFGGERLQCEYVWSIDPIDGTEAFAAGLPQFGTLLALIRQTEDGQRQPLLGMIYLPLQHQLIIGNGVSTMLNRTPVRMPACPNMDRQCLILGNVATLAREVPGDSLARLFSLASRFRSAQTWGDCWGYLGMLLGTAHARLEAGLGVDDIAPIEPIVLGAGGMVSDWTGRSIASALSLMPSLEAKIDGFSVVAASSPVLHRQIMGLL